MLRNEDKNWGMACHLTALCMYIGIPFGNILGPLVVWLIKKNDSPFIDDQGKESLNFQISMTLYSILPILFCITIIGLFVGIPLLIVLGIVHLVFTIIGAVRASNGEQYRYPLTIRFVN
jgi:uncharacterized Tic20 family protein